VIGAEVGGYKFEVGVVCPHRYIRVIFDGGPSSCSCACRVCICGVGLRFPVELVGVHGVGVLPWAAVWRGSLARQGRVSSNIGRKFFTLHAHNIRGTVRTAPLSGKVVGGGKKSVLR
jgi:hypothetical protein